MKKYFTHNGSQQEGPFDLEELKSKKITKETPIWYEGLNEWTTAGKAEELTVLFAATTPPPFKEKAVTPPPLQKEKPKETITFQAPKKKNKTGRTVFIALIAIGVLLVVGYFIKNSINSGNDGYDYSTDGNSYEEKVMTVEEIELADPTRFLHAEGTYRENFWGDKIKITCEIINNATVATYKDAVIEFTYYSKSETVIGSEVETVYDIFGPNSAKTVYINIPNYQDVSSVGWEVIDASPY